MSSQEPAPTPAEVQFNTSSIYVRPNDWPPEKPLFQIRNDYPNPAPIGAAGLPPLPLPDVAVEAPWLHVRFDTEPEKYARLIKEYCWDGNRPVDFVVQENKQRAWYHAPWMHASDNGREQIKGLTFERSIPPLEFANTQTDALQNWAIGFYNSPGASVFGGVWKDPNDPVWVKDLKFPKGTCTFKLLLTTASDDQVPTMKGSPEWSAVISPQPDPTKAPPSGHVRNDFTSPVRLIQVDWAVTDECSPIGWVFGTFMYNCHLEDKFPDPWDRLTPVGVQWGNDPQLNQAAVDAGEKPQQCWINPEAEALRLELGGLRPSWGWNGRLNGPADNFVSACASCHSTAQSSPAPMVQDGALVDKKWIPRSDALTMTWFENVPAGEPFSVRGALSCDYSLQFMIGWNNYQNWLTQQKAAAAKKKSNVLMRFRGRRVVFRPRDGDSEKTEKDMRHLLDRIEIEEEPLRAGPDMKWT